MLLHEPRTAPEASRLIRCTEAAARLDARIYPIPGKYACEIESFKTDENGQRVSNRYVVDVDASTCTCPDFRKHLTFCKHLIWLEPFIRMAEEKVAAADALFDQAQQAVDIEDGRLFMQNLHTERSLLAC
ncbi:MAG: hypothetical protein JWN14_3005 [Chthonomonadales bacterium]|nr:hypothetical protein [Chthonomonadales bacterium]